MSKRYVVCGLALVVALCFALPAVGAAPSSLADALGLAKKANKRAAQASERATRAAQRAAAAAARADAAGSAASRAQGTADAATASAAAAQTAAAQADAKAASAQSRADEAAAAAGAARSTARQVYNDGPTTVANGISTTLATMSAVAPGAYVITAKTDVRSNGNTASTGVLRCTATAGAGSDSAAVQLGAGNPPNELTAVAEATLQANFVHTFTSSGSVTFTCTNELTNGVSATARHTKIIAIRVGEISDNTAVTG